MKKEVENLSLGLKNESNKSVLSKNGDEINAKTQGLNSKAQTETKGKSLFGNIAAS